MDSSETSYMSIKEFCDKLQVSTSTVYRMIREGILPAAKFGRHWKIPRNIDLGDNDNFKIAPVTSKNKDKEEVNIKTNGSGFIYFVTFSSNEVDEHISAFKNIAKARDWLTEASVRNFIKGCFANDMEITFEGISLSPNKDEYSMLLNEGLLGQFIHDVINDKESGNTLTKYRSKVKFPDGSYFRMHTYRFNTETGKLDELR